MKHLPNIISIIRIPLSLCLLLVINNSFAFMILYFLCGISDVLDGYIARKMNWQSLLGAKLDSIADFIMYAVIIIILGIWNWHSIIRFAPTLMLITLIRGINIGLLYIKFHQASVIHTIGNKCAGLLVYSIPLLYLFTGGYGFLWTILSILILVSLEETFIIIRMKELDLNRKGLFFSHYSISGK